MTQECEQLTEIIRSAYRMLDDAGVESISTNDLADEVYKIIDPDNISPVMVHYAALMELRQEVRAVCRKKHAQDEYVAESTQTSLWPNLQPRYPAERNGTDCYVQRDKLTLEEREANISRLRAEATAKNAHADALQAETDSLVKRGVLVRQGED